MEQQHFRKRVIDRSMLVFGLGIGAFCGASSAISANMGKVEEAQILNIFGVANLVGSVATGLYIQNLENRALVESQPPRNNADSESNII